MPKERDYKEEYRRWDKERNKQPHRVRAKKGWNRARYLMKKAGKAKVGDGKDVDHIDKNPNNNSRSNLRMTSKKFNRGRSNGGHK